MSSSITRSIKGLTERLGKPIHLSPEAWEKLLLYDYPGNVRQLQNILERTVALARGPVIEAGHIHLERPAGQPSAEDVDNESPEGDGRLALEDMTLRHIRRVLSLYHGNQVAAAKALAISRSTLRRRLGLD